jgi:cytochrome oxidase Cu insertion factor (SCO1/SenC/PrrC family)
MNSPGNQNQPFKMRNSYISAAALLAAALLICSAPAARAQGFASADGAKKTDAGDFYSCPMHPEVKSKKKGRCPLCKMDLRPAQSEAQPAARADAPGDLRTKTASAETARATHASSKMTIPDVELLDQDGRKVRFYTDLVKGKTVAVQFIFTTCTTICPPLGATFARVQKELGERAGRDVRLISVSVDPVTDTPERLKAWGAKFKAGPGWTFITGTKPQVDELLRALGADVASPAEHSPTVLVGNDATGQWTRAYGMARPAALVKLIDDATAGRLDSTTDSAATDSAAKESTRP